MARSKFMKLALTVRSEGEPLHDVSPEGPGIGEVDRQHGLGRRLRLDAPAMVADRSVDRVRRLVQRELVVLPVEREPPVAHASRPWRHREDPVVAVVVLGAQQQLQPVDLELGDPTAARGVDDEPRVSCLEGEHRRLSRDAR